MKVFLTTGLRTLKRSLQADEDENHLAFCPIVEAFYLKHFLETVFRSLLLASLYNGPVRIYILESLANIKKQGAPNLRLSSDNSPSLSV